MKTSCFVSIIICLTVACGGCGNMQFQSNEKPEDKVIVPETLKESPKSNLQDLIVGKSKIYFSDIIKIYELEK